MTEKISIEVDSTFLKKYFELADLPVPENPSLNDFNNVADKIKNKFNTIASLQNISPEINSNSKSSSSNVNLSNNKNALVVDDLGIVTVQLESILKKIGFEVTVSRELFDAIEKYKTQDFGYAITDLFIPTEREGFVLIDEIKKLSLLCKLNTKIIVMTASSKKEHKDKCLNRGADFFVEKIPGWQKRIAEICLEKEH